MILICTLKNISKTSFWMSFTSMFYYIQNILEYRCIVCYFTEEPLCWLQIFNIKMKTTVHNILVHLGKPFWVIYGYEWNYWSYDFGL